MNLVKTDITYGAWDPGSIFGPPSSHSKTPSEAYGNFFPHSEEPEYQVVGDEEEGNHEFHDENQIQRHERRDSTVETSDVLDEKILESENRDNEPDSVQDVGDEDSLNEDEMEHVNIHDNQGESIWRDQSDSLNDEIPENDNELDVTAEEDSLNEQEMNSEDDEIDNEDDVDATNSSEARDENVSEHESDSIAPNEEDSLGEEEIEENQPEPELDSIPNSPVEEQRPTSLGSPIFEDSLDERWGDEEPEPPQEEVVTNESTRVEEHHNENIFDSACCKIQKLTRGYLVRKIPLRLPPIAEDENQPSPSPYPVEEEEEEEEDVIMFHQVQKKPSHDKDKHSVRNHSPSYFFSLPDSIAENQDQDSSADHSRGQGRDEEQDIDQEIENLERLFVDASQEFDEGSSSELEEQELGEDSVSEGDLMEDSIEPIRKPEAPSCQMRLLEILANDDSDWDQMVGSIATPGPAPQSKQTALPTVNELRRLASEDPALLSARSTRAKAATEREEGGVMSDPRVNQQRLPQNKLNAPLISRRHHAALLIQRVVRGHIARRLAAERREKMKLRFACPNCGMLEQGGLYCKRCGRRVLKQPANKGRNSKGSKRRGNDPTDPPKNIVESHPRKPPNPSVRDPPPLEMEPQQQLQNRKEMKERKAVSRIPIPTPTDLPKANAANPNGNRDPHPVRHKRTEQATQQPQPQPHHHAALLSPPKMSPPVPQKKKKQSANQPPPRDPIPPKHSAAAGAAAVVRPLKVQVPVSTNSVQRKPLPRDTESNSVDEQLSPNSNHSAATPIPTKPPAARIPHNLPPPKKSQITIPFPCSLLGEGSEQRTQVSVSEDCGYLGHYYKANPKSKVPQQQSRQLQPPPPLPLEVMSPPKPAVEEKRNSLPVLNHKNSLPQELKGKGRPEEKHRMESTRSAPPRIKEREGEKLSLPPPVRRSHDYESAPAASGDVSYAHNNKIRMKGDQAKRKRSSL